MKSKQMKKFFEVQDHETISDCLYRMEKEGYQPVRRLEKPLFIEIKDRNKQIRTEVYKQNIVFEGRKL